MLISRQLTPPTRFGLSIIISVWGCPLVQRMKQTTQMNVFNMIRKVYITLFLFVWGHVRAEQDTNSSSNCELR